MSPKALPPLQVGGYQGKLIKNIQGSGYVVESLEAALWCFHHTNTFEEAILQAANLGMMPTPQLQYVVRLPEFTMVNQASPAIGKSD